MAVRKIPGSNWRPALGVILSVLCSVAQAAPVTARLDRSSAVVGETVTLALETNDSGQSLETDLSALQKDFDVLNQRSESQVSFVNGRKTASVKLVVTLEPRRAGELTIPALKFPGARSEPLTLKVSAAPEAAPGDVPPVFIEVAAQPESGPYYVLSQVGLTVRIFYLANLTEAAINPPAPAQAAVRLLDEVSYQSSRGGETYRVLERRYAVFPERSGSLVVPPMELSGRLIERSPDRLWQPAVRGRRVRVESEPLSLEITPRPTAYSGAFWLPARSLSLSQQISDGGKLHVGEPVTRTVILDATGLEEHMLEEPPWPEVPAVRIYPDQPQGITRDDGEWVLGHKEFRYAVVPEEPGELVLPEIRLDWWDTVAGRQRTEVLPEHRLTVLPSRLAPSSRVLPQLGAELPAAPAAAPAAPAASAGLWRAASAVFAVLWLLTLLLHFRRGRTPAPSADGDVPGAQQEKALLRQLQQACRRGDAPAARRALARWARHYAPQGAGASMRGFGESCGDAALRHAIEALDESGFAAGAGAGWEGDVLWAAFRHWRARAPARRPADVGEKPDLYAA